MNTSFSLVQRSFFFLLLTLTTLAFIWLLSSFFTPILWALAFAVVFYPLSSRISYRLGNRPTIASLITIICVLVLVLLPLYGIGNLLAREAVDLYYRLASEETMQYLLRLEETPIAQQLLNVAGLEQGELRARVIEIGQTAASWLATQAFTIGTNAASIVLKVFIMMYLLFVFLRNGPQISARIMSVLPLGNDKEVHLFERFTSTVRALFRGTLIVALAQGLVGGVLFAIAGIPNPLLWGVVMSIFALIPAIGPGIIWLPTGLVLLAIGEIMGGAIILAGGALLVGLLDNVLRPILIGRDLEMSDALVMLSIIGGLVTFGINGFIIGPIIASLFLATWSLFEQEYRSDLAQHG